MSDKSPELTADITQAPELPRQNQTSSNAKTTAPPDAESPRTAREPDFDDDSPDTHLPLPDKQTPPAQKKRVSFQDDEAAPNPPQKPPRPLSPNAQAEATLIEAFPSLDSKVVKAVLVASGGKVEPAFNAMLGMSDPDFQDQPPPPPPRKALTQLESDELYARQLAEHFNATHDGFGSRSRGDPSLPRRKETGLKPNELYDDREHSFIDDDLPVIRKNIEQGFVETKNTINKWIKDFQKKLDGEENDDPIPRPGGREPPLRQDYGPSQSNQLHGIRRAAEASRRSGERDRYDADPQLLSDDFGHRLELRDDEAPPARPPRPLANSKLVRASGSSDVSQESAVTSSGPRGPGGISRQPSPNTVAGKSGKWQPLTSVEPKADLEDHDPFSLGDSDEDLDTKKETKPAQDKGNADSSKVATESYTKTSFGEGASSSNPASDLKESS